MFILINALSQSGEMWSISHSMIWTIKDPINIGRDKHIILVLNCDYLLTHQFKHVFGAQKNRLIKTVLLSTHNICFG